MRTSILILAILSISQAACIKSSDPICKELDKTIDNNIKIIALFQDRGIKIEGIEIGNEMQIYTGVTGEFNRNTAKYKEAIDIMFQITEDVDNRIFTHDTGLLTGACYPTPMAAAANGRDRYWAEVFARTSCNALIVHHYEEDTNPATWQPKLNAMVTEIHDLGKEAWFTEGMWNFGPGTNHPKYAASLAIPNTWKAYKSNWFQMVTDAGFDIATYHRLSTNMDHPYDYDPSLVTFFNTK
jgi:hypothetical protein